MDIAFVDAELGRVCNSDAARRARFGSEAAATLHRRLGEIAAATHLADLRHVASARLRSGPPDDRFARLVSLGVYGELLVHPRDSPPVLDQNGLLDEHSVRAVIVTAITITR
ncbi:hypothetical protein BN159_4451 [Streptomyces davaonensis JCM 4913]|uniref:Uncharacterized protein n=1 Tax=Streptomyces davaonensis (strain DSM 101723 / JCM 4913 / KCC S-0913 / 768) TaxID=1214101 RepID=K4R703_STRDJ|nr:hypothetical protein [Streptomyces davaonensis]CCK28830.1 hypothetical protein BN159_4451 [Streptomyces davaonensis JCM 4913]